MPIDRDKLEALAKAAHAKYPERWYSVDEDGFDASIRAYEPDGSRHYGDYVEIARTGQVSDGSDGPDDIGTRLPDYLAAVPPIVVLELLDSLKAAEATVARVTGFVDHVDTGDLMDPMNISFLRDVLRAA